MNKIIKALLEAKYPTINVSILLDIISATPNAEIATEMLCGLYEAPVIPHKLVNSGSSEGILTFKGYDKWQDRVIYTYKTPETKGVYVKAGTKKEEVTMENIESFKSSASDRIWIEIPTGKTVERTSYVSLSRWNDYPEEISEGRKKQLEQENLYSN